MTHSGHGPVRHHLPLHPNLVCLPSVVPRPSSGMVACTELIPKQVEVLLWRFATLFLPLDLLEATQLRVA